MTAVYKSPAMNGTDFINNFSNYISTQCKKRSEILCGDSNIDILSEPNNNDIKSSISICYYHMVSTHINKYTREFNNSKSCLDHFFVKSRLDQNNIIPVILE